MVDRRRRERMYHAALKAVAVTTNASICTCILQFGSVGASERSCEYTRVKWQTKKPIPKRDSTACSCDDDRGAKGLAVRQVRFCARFVRVTGHVSSVSLSPPVAGAV